MIVDTGVLLAALNDTDVHHGAAAALLSGPGSRVVPEPVVVEADWLVVRRLGVDAELGFLRGLSDGGVVVESCTPEDRERIIELVEAYRDARIGYVDAAIVAVAERLGETRIATLDRRDFSMIRPRHTAAFELVP